MMNCTCGIAATIPRGSQNHVTATPSQQDLNLRTWALALLNEVVQ